MAPRDSFRQQIVSGLAGLSDPLAFERCMGDLLVADFPGLVPVPGGTDSGMDGAIADGEGEPFPLVCTIADDVIGNLTRSLDSYLKRGLPARKVALATSRKLTPRRRHSLFDRAREKGFTLVQVFDLEALANRLADNPRLCKELLDLSPRRSALSSVPPVRRAWIEIEPVGREADLAWIETTPGDRVVSGAPGSGKTFLFYHLMRNRDWPGLFLVGIEGFEEAWLEQRPELVVVDDAHGNLDQLRSLIHLRHEMGMPFQVVATTWERECEWVVEALAIPERQVRRLELLTRDEILQVIRQVGVEAPDEVLRDLVSQSANKPGLAVTIASLWLQGSYQEVLEGTALTRSLTTFFDRFLGSRSTDVLACLALGGDRGMDSEGVRVFLRLSPPDFREIAAGLSAGGVLSQVDGSILAVWPRKLRYSLVRTVFFSGAPGSYDYKQFLELAPSRQSVAETLVGAKHHGADVPMVELREIVAQSGSLDAWRGLATSGRDEALWVLESYPDDIVRVAYAALIHAPEPTILRLLNESGLESPDSFSKWTAPIKKWLGNPDVFSVELVRRRRALARASQEYLHGKGKRSVGLHGICLALSPTLESQASDPGAGNTVILRWGLLPLAQLQEVKAIWAQVRPEFEGLEAEDWKRLSEVLWAWMHPSYAARGEVAEEATQFMRAFAAEILRDIAPSVQSKPGLNAKVRGLAESLGIEVSLEPDSLFDLLFPSRELLVEQRSRWEANWQASLDALADQWLIRDPVECAEDFVRYEKEALSVGRAWSPRGDVALCRRIAALARTPEGWLDSLLGHGASGALTGPFLEALVESRRVGWESQIERFLELNPSHAWAAMESALRFTSPTDRLFQKALERLVEFPQLLEVLCLRRQIPVEGLRAILRDPRRVLALTAAEGEWNADPKGTVRTEVASDWRSAVLRSSSDDESEESDSPSLTFWLREILSDCPELAYDWLIAQRQGLEWPSYIEERGPFQAALSALGREQRVRLLVELGSAQPADGLVASLTKKDPEIFKKVLSLEFLRGRHLEPLGFLPDEAWMSLALVALEAGYATDEIARASFMSSNPIVVNWGRESEEWARYERAFIGLELDRRPEVREIARCGRNLAVQLCNEAAVQGR